MSTWTGMSARQGVAEAKYRMWFRRVVLFGVFVNVSLGLPTVFRPNFVLGLLGVPLTHEPLWANFAAFLLILMTLFYVPGALDSMRYRANAWLAIFARFITVLFFVLTPYRNDWLLFGMIDLTFFLPQVVLLTLAERARSAAA